MILRYTGMCDASAAVPLDGETFLVGDDERNTLRVYRRDRGGPPVQEIAWDRQLAIRPSDEHPEADIEGATILDGRLYWIASHGRSRKGEWRPNRHRFFAMTVSRGGEGFVTRPFGKTCDTLILDLARDDRMNAVGLAEALDAGEEEDDDLAPKKEGLNVEGLCAAADDKSLLIAFRNPLHDGKALLVPLHNHGRVLADGATPTFGDPIELRLAPRAGRPSRPLGIRSIEYSHHHNAYLIVAGPTGEERGFALFRWSGARDAPAEFLPKATRKVNAVEDFTPEALIVYPGDDPVQLLSDDGALPVKVDSPAECRPGEYHDGRCEAKHLLDDSRKTFRSMEVAVE